MSSEQSAFIVVAGVVVHDGKVLIQCRSKENHPDCADDSLTGRWEFPGGKVEFGEDLGVALQRELEEETGFSVAVDKLLYAQINTYESGRDYLVLFYECHLLKPPLPTLRRDLTFVNIESIGIYNMLPGAFEAIKSLERDEFSFVEHDVTHQTPEETLHIATYELGHVIEYSHKAKRYGATGYYSEENQKKEMSDLISMCRFYCEQRGWNYRELEKLGEEGYVERMEDLVKYGKKRDQV